MAFVIDYLHIIVVATAGVLASDAFLVNVLDTLKFIPVAAITLDFLTILVREKLNEGVVGHILPCVDETFSLALYIVRFILLEVLIK